MLLVTENQGTIDSLNDFLSTRPEEEKASVLNILSREHLYIDPQRTVEYARQASVLATRYNNERDLAVSLKNLGHGYLWLRQYKKAVSAYTHALRYEEHIHEKTNLNALYNNLGIAYKVLGQYSDALPCYEKSLAIKQELGDSAGMSNTLRNMGNLMLAMGEYGDGLELWKRALSVANAVRESVDIAISTAAIAGLYKDLGDYDTALEYALRALHMAEHTKDAKCISNANRSLGVIYKNLGELDAALQHATRALELDISINDSVSMAAELSNIAIIYKHQDNMEKALEFQKRSLQIRRILGDRSGEATCLINIGNIITRSGNPKRALEMHKTALSIANDIGIPVTSAEALINIAAVSIDLGEYDAARDAALQSLNIAHSENLLDFLHTGYRYLSDSYAGLGDYKHALSSFKLHSQAKDSIFNSESDKRVKELQIRYETERKEKEIELLKKDAEINTLELTQQRNLKRSFIAISLLAGILALVVYNRYRLKNKANHEITRKNEELENAYRKMEEMARTDPLTTLSNRRDILERITYEYVRTKRSGNPFSIIIGDVDNFKRINDQYGHDCGDYVLVTLADIFRNTLREQDIVGRWGGEEFIFVIPDSNTEGGAVLAEKLRIRIEEKPFGYRGDAVPVTMTFGVTGCNGTRRYDVCITEADKALYAGKRAGRNRVVAAG